MSVKWHNGGYEKRDANANLLLLIGGGLIGLILVFMAIVFGLLKGLEAFHAGPDPAPSSALAEKQGPPPEPRLQSDPTADYQSLRATEDSILRAYGWVDRGTGIAKVPIDTANAMLVNGGRIEVRRSADSLAGGIETARTPR